MMMSQMATLLSKAGYPFVWARSRVISSLTALPNIR